MVDHVGEVQMNMPGRDRGYVILFCLVMVAASSWLVAEAGLSAAFARRQEANSLLVREFSARTHLIILQIVQSFDKSEVWQDSRTQTWCAKGPVIHLHACDCLEADRSCIEINIGDAKPSDTGTLRRVRIHSPALETVLPAETRMQAIIGLKCLRGGARACEEYTLQLREWHAL